MEYKKLSEANERLSLNNKALQKKNVILINELQNAKNENWLLKKMLKNSDFKTTEEIINDWDEYKNKHIDYDKDWSKEHDNYLNKKWVSYNDN